MPRVSRMIVQNQTAVYHVMSRTALDGFPLEAFEKDFLLDLIKRMSGLFFFRNIRVRIDGKPFSSAGKDDS